MKGRVVSYGEALVDFLPDRTGALLRDVETFTKSVGGAPANVSVGMARLGCEVAHLGKVGDDEFGHFLAKELQAEGVDSAGLTRAVGYNTGITFISLTPSGDRSFMFFREKSAELEFGLDDIDEDLISSASILVAGSNLLMEGPVREATYRTLQIARDAGVFVVLDPNIRIHRWADKTLCRDQVAELMRHGDVVKLNEEELEFMSGTSDGEALWKTLQDDGLLALIVTRAENGAVVHSRAGFAETSAPLCETVVDTTGAGDGFVAGLVAGIQRLLDEPDPRRLRAAAEALGTDEWRTLARLGCWVGTEVCKKLGATPGLPKAAAVPWKELGF